MSTGAFSDFTIACGGQERKVCTQIRATNQPPPSRDFERSTATTDSTTITKQVHRIILNAGSGYFEAMFRVPCQETLSGRLELPDDDADLVWWMIDYIYHGHVRICAPPPPPDAGRGVNLLETCVAMYAMGAKFQVSGLQDSAEEAIGRMLAKKQWLRDILDMVDAVDELTADRDELRLRVWNWLGRRHSSAARRYAAEVMMHWDTGDARFSSRVHVRELYMDTRGGNRTMAGAMGPSKRQKLG